MTNIVEEQAWQLSPIQQFFFDKSPQGHDHFNQSFVLGLARRVPRHVLEEALQSSVNRHSMLRARFRQNQNGDWEQFIARAKPQTHAFSEHHLDQESEIYSIIKRRHKTLDIINGPVFAANLFNISGGHQILFLVAHHLVIDLVSWHILLHEIEQTITGKETTSSEALPFQIWTKLQYEDSQIRHPTQVVPFQVDVKGLDFWNVSPTDKTYDQAENYQTSLDKPTTKLLLGAANDAFGTEPADILSAAIVHSFRSVFPERKAPVLFFEGHGREKLGDVKVDLSGTIGWFTTFQPLEIPGKATDRESDIVRLAKDTRNRVPGKGRPYFAYQYHNAQGREDFKNHASMELLFNYTGGNQQIGKANSLFQSMDVPESINANNISLTAQRLALIEVTASIEEGSLTMDFGLHRKMQHQYQVKEWIKTFTGRLKVMVSNLTGRKREWTLSDFPLLRLNYRDLEILVKDRIP